MWKGIWKTTEVALKELGDQQIEALRKEGQNMMKLTHPNVVKFWGIYTGKYLPF